MKIVLLTGFFDENFVYREHAYANYFNKNNIDYLILTSTLALTQKSRVELPCDSGKYKVVRIQPFFSLKDIIFFKTWNTLNSYNPDIVHLFDAQQGIALFGILFALIKKKKIIYDHELQKFPSGILARIRFILLTYPILLFITIYSNKIRCVTPSGASLLKKINPFCRKKISLEPLGYEMKKIANIDLPFSIPDCENLISMTGYFDTKKNLKPILAAFLRSSYKHSNAFLIVIGPILDKKTVEFIKKYKKIIYYENLLKQDQLEFLLSKSKINIWPKSTSTIFEALKYDNYVILPKNAQTNHLDSLQIKLLDNFTFISIKNQFNFCYQNLKVSDNSKFDYDNILKKLLIQYEIVYNEK